MANVGKIIASPKISGWKAFSSAVTVLLTIFAAGILSPEIASQVSPELAGILAILSGLVMGLANFIKHSM